jgi:hypothetical protein
MDTTLGNTLKVLKLTNPLHLAQATTTEALCSDAWANNPLF